MEAAVTSPAQNMVDGKGQQYKKEFIQFLYIIRGSLFEIVTLIEFSEDKSFLMKILHQTSADGVRKSIEKRTDL